MSEELNSIDDFSSPEPSAYVSHSSHVDELYKALIEAQGEFTAVPKRKTATVRTKSGGEYFYKYADLADVLAMALPVLSRHGLGVIQPYIMVNRQLRLCTRLIHVSGQWLQSDGLLISEIAPRQEFGADSTYDRRYDLCSLLGIVADEDVDAAPHMDEKATGKRPVAVRQPEAIKAPSAPKSEPSSNQGSEAEQLLAKRDRIVRELKEVEPDAHALGKRAAQMFPEHRSTKTLNVEDLDRLLQTIKKEKAQEKLEPETEASSIFEGKKPEVNTSAPKATIGKGLAKRLHTLISVNKVHTEQELYDEYLKPMGIEHISDLPQNLYDVLCDWAEGKIVEGTSVVDPEELNK